MKSAFTFQWAWNQVYWQAYQELDLPCRRGGAKGWSFYLFFNCHQMKAWY